MHLITTEKHTWSSRTSLNHSLEFHTKVCCRNCFRVPSGYCIVDVMLPQPESIGFHRSHPLWILVFSKVPTFSFYLLMIILYQPPTLFTILPRIPLPSALPPISESPRKFSYHILPVVRRFRHLRKASEQRLDGLAPRFSRLGVNLGYNLSGKNERKLIAQCRWASIQ